MKRIDRILPWLTFRLFNLWHTVGFLFKPFLTIGVCLILTVLLNALLFLVMHAVQSDLRIDHWRDGVLLCFRLCRVFQ